MPQKVAAIDRLFRKVVKCDGCWIWNGATARGYGYLHVDGKAKSVHRLSWEFLRENPGRNEYRPPLLHA